MGAWFVGGKTPELVYDALGVMKQEPAECDDLGREVWVTFLIANQRWDREVCGVEPCEDNEIFLDGGGAISTTEAKVGWAANGVKLKTYVTHLPFFIARFEALTEDPKLPGCAGFHGFHRVYVLSMKTVAESIEHMKRLQKGTESLRQEAELEKQDVMNNIPNVASVRPCGCMSGELYVKCCGKFVESEQHKENRAVLEKENHEEDAG